MLAMRMKISYNIFSTDFLTVFANEKITRGNQITKSSEARIKPPSPYFTSGFLF